jgi:hypothetical protein
MFHAALSLASLKAGTLRDYAYGKRKLLTWLAQKHASFMSTELFCDFLRDLLDAGYSYAVANQARSWLAMAERWLSPTLNKLGVLPVSGNARLRMDMRGYKQFTKGWPLRTIPIHMGKLFDLLCAPIPDCIKMALALGYGFLLRAHEVADLFDGLSSVTAISGGRYSLFLQRSKADAAGLGVHVTFPHDCIPYFLRVWVDQFIQLPLQNLNMSQVTSVLHVFLGPGFRFHGLRHGRCQDLMGLNMAENLVMYLGRWHDWASFSLYRDQ